MQHLTLPGDVHRIVKGYYELDVHLCDPFHFRESMSSGVLYHLLSTFLVACVLLTSSLARLPVCLLSVLA